jgi:hypothetical protein
LHAALKRFTHGWLVELSWLATVTAADAYVRYKLGEDDEPPVGDCFSNWDARKGVRFWTVG